MSVLSTEKERERERSGYFELCIGNTKSGTLQRLKLEDKTRLVDRWEKLYG